MAVATSVTTHQRFVRIVRLLTTTGEPTLLYRIRIGPGRFFRYIKVTIRLVA